MKRKYDKYFFYYLLYQEYNNLREKFINKNLFENLLKNFF